MELLRIKSKEPKLPKIYTPQTDIVEPVRIKQKPAWKRLLLIGLKAPTHNPSVKKVRPRPSELEERTIQTGGEAAPQLSILPAAQGSVCQAVRQSDEEEPGSPSNPESSTQPPNLGEVSEEVTNRNEVPNAQHYDPHKETEPSTLASSVPDVSAAPPVASASEISTVPQISTVSNIPIVPKVSTVPDPVIYQFEKDVFISPGMLIAAEDREAWKHIGSRLIDTLEHLFKPQSGMNPVVEFMMAGRSPTQLRPSIMIICCTKPHKAEIKRIVKTQKWIASHKYPCLVLIDPIQKLSALRARDNGQTPSSIPVVGKPSSTGAIVGGVLGGLAIIAALAALIFFLFRRNKRKLIGPALVPQTALLPLPTTGGDAHKDPELASNKKAYKPIAELPPPSEIFYRGQEREQQEIESRARELQERAREHRERAREHREGLRQEIERRDRELQERVHQKMEADHASNKHTTAPTISFESPHVTADLQTSDIIHTPDFDKSQVQKLSQTPLQVGSGALSQPISLFPTNNSPSQSRKLFTTESAEAKKMIGSGLEPTSVYCLVDPTISTLCGALAYSDSKAHSAWKSQFTIGGVIVIDNVSYGLTTGHNLNQDNLLDLGANISEYSEASYDDSSSVYISFDGEDTRDLSDSTQGPIDIASKSFVELGSLPLAEKAPSITHKSSHFEYMGLLDTLPVDESRYKPHLDWEVIKIKRWGPFSWFVNRVAPVGDSESIMLTSIIKTKDFKDGEVTIVAGSSGLVKGWLRSCPVYMQFEGASFEAMQIVFDKPLGKSPFKNPAQLSR